MISHPFYGRKSTLIKHLFLMSLVISLLFAIPKNGQARDITWTGCGIIKKAFMSQIAASFEEKYGTKIELSGGGASKGIRAASAGTSDLGGTCRHWLLNSGRKHPQEKDAILTQVAWDALVVIVHPDNPVDNISLADLKGIYKGEITSWSQLGGPDKRIALVTREGKSSGVGHMFRYLVFDDSEYEFEGRSFKVSSSSVLEKKVVRTEAALGMTGISSARKREVKMLSIDGAQPTKENIASGKYPIFRPLYIATNKTPSPEARRVVDFLLSDEGQKIISEEGTVNLQEGKSLEPFWAKKKTKIGL